MALGKLLNWRPGRGPALAASLYDVWPDASSLPRMLPRAEIVTVPSPFRTTVDGLPAASNCIMVPPLMI